jgi:hypothetical protein
MTFHRLPRTDDAYRQWREHSLSREEMQPPWWNVAGVDYAVDAPRKRRPIAGRLFAYFGVIIGCALGLYLIGLAFGSRLFPGVAS